MRKSRRKIKRRKRLKIKKRKNKSVIARHFSGPITNTWTKVTTYILMIFEATFVIWWLQDLFINWEYIIERLEAIF